MNSKSILREALGIDALSYPIPKHAQTLPYALGGITLFAFILAILSGIILTQFYNPSPDSAHASVKYISEAPFLSIVRGVHYWSANIAFGLMILHMLRVLWTFAYRYPRIVNYAVGLLLFMTVFMLYFSGTVVKWDQEAIEALEHFVATGAFAGPLAPLFREDFTLSTSMLARFYSLHIGILPIILAGAISLHFFFIRYHGISPKPTQSADAYEASKSAGTVFSHHLRKLVGYWLILFGAVMLLALFFIPPLFNAPFAGIETTKPPWPFWTFYPLEAKLGAFGIVLGSAIVIFGLILVPIVDAVIPRPSTKVLVTRALVVLGVIGWIILLVITYFSPVMKHLG